MEKKWSLRTCGECARLKPVEGRRVGYCPISKRRNGITIEGGKVVAWSMHACKNFEPKKTNT